MFHSNIKHQPTRKHSYFLWGLLFLFTLWKEAQLIRTSDPFETLPTFLPWMSVKLLYILIAGLTFLGYALLYYMLHMRRRISPEVIFAFLYLVLGICYFCSVPMYKTPDEPAHFYRAYEVSEGDWLSEVSPSGTAAGCELPSALAQPETMDLHHVTFQDVSTYDQLELNHQERKFVPFSGAALYAPGTYIPQALGILLMRLFTQNVLAIMYAARFMNWLITGIILYICLKFLPFGKELAITIFLIPMNLHQYVSMSADSFTFAICTALLTFVLYLRFTQTTPLSKKQYVLLYLLIFILCQCKVVYLILALLLFLIPPERFETRKNYIVQIVLIAAMILLIGAGWLLLSTRLLSTTNPAGSAEKTAFLIQQPLAFIQVLLSTITQRMGEYIATAIGARLGWLDINIDLFLIYAYLLLIIAIARRCGTLAPTWKKWERVFTLGICLLITLLIFVSVFIQWTSASNAADILGIQGRYFAPLLLPFAYAMAEPRKATATTQQSLVYPIILSINLCVCTQLLSYAL